MAYLVGTMQVRQEGAQIKTDEANYLTAACKQVIEETLGEEAKSCRRAIKHGMVSSIEIFAEGRCLSLHLVTKPPLLHGFASSLLGDESPDDATLADLSKEMANLIAGVAKRLAKDHHKSWEIGTPTSITGKTLATEKSSWNHALHFKVNASFFSLYLGESRGK